ncbi:MAG: spore coat U domain-containing protein [Pseudomonadota bacterium]
MFLKKSLIAAALGFAAVGASAQTTGNIVVSANVIAACNISVANLAFGNYDSLAGAPLQASTTVSAACSQGSIPVISLGAGGNASGAQRRMNQGASFLSYDLYKPATNLPAAACAYTTSWGDGGATGTALTATAAPSLVSRSYSVCGQIPVGQNAVVGAYTDTVVANIAF